MPTLDTLAKIKNLVISIYEGGQAPTHEEWLIILMLNTLKATKYESLHTTALTFPGQPM